MSKKTIIYIVLIFLGMSLIAIPIISNYINIYKQTMIISDYTEKVQELPEEKKKEKLQNAKIYNENLERDTAIDLSLAKKEKNLKSTDVLKIGETIGYISIPKIQVYLPIYQGITKKVLQSGVGHIEKSSLPVGGKNTHSVLAGHTGLAKTKIFDDIDKLKIGDKFYIHIFDEVLIYQVDKIDVVEPDDTDTIKVEEDKDYITLVTCTPRKKNTHRLLVRGTRIEENNIELNNVEESNVEDNKLENITYTDAQEINKSDEISEQSIQKLKKDSRNNMIFSIVIAIIFFIIILIIFFWDDIKKNCY